VDFKQYFPKTNIFIYNSRHAEHAKRGNRITEGLRHHYADGGLRQQKRIQEAVHESAKQS